jgi:hypothetical protein
MSTKEPLALRFGLVSTDMIPVAPGSYVPPGYVLFAQDESTGAAVAVRADKERIFVANKISVMGFQDLLNIARGSQPVMEAR